MSIIGVLLLNMQSRGRWHTNINQV